MRLIASKSLLVRPLGLGLLCAGLLLVEGCGTTQWSSAVSPTTRPDTGVTTPERVQDWITYHDPSGLGLQHPSAWATQSGELSPLIVYIDTGRDGGGFRRNINVVVQTLPSGFSAADYLRTSVDQMTSTGGVVEDNRIATLGGLAGHQVTWHYAKSGLTFRFLSVWTVRGGKAFLVTYTSDPDNFDAPLPDVERLVATITLPPG